MIKIIGIMELSPCEKIVGGNYFGLGLIFKQIWEYGSFVSRTQTPHQNKASMVNPKKENETNVHRIHFFLNYFS